jgi:hypothetical protein
MSEVVEITWCNCPPVTVPNCSVYVTVDDPEQHELFDVQQNAERSATARSSLESKNPNFGRYPRLVNYVQ